MNEPPVRYHTAAARQFISASLGLRNDAAMQDWECEVANPADIERYLAMFAEVSSDADVRFTLADMILQAFEDSECDLEADLRWSAFLLTLLENVEVHTFQIWYWSNWHEELEDGWRITPFMRDISRRIH